jgi:hypothetical protein
MILNLDLQHYHYTNTNKNTNKGIRGFKPSAKEEGVAGALAITSVEATCASSTWRTGSRGATGYVREAVEKQQRCR